MNMLGMILPTSSHTPLILSSPALQLLRVHKDLKLTPCLADLCKVTIPAFWLPFLASLSHITFTS